MMICPKCGNRLREKMIIDKEKTEAYFENLSTIDIMNLGKEDKTPRYSKKILFCDNCNKEIQL